MSVQQLLESVGGKFSNVCVAVHRASAGVDRGVRRIARREFLQSDPPNVSIYTCGPTVYSNAHIGNFRAYVFEDLLQRHLEARGFDVQRVMNLTDVDDKTIRGSREAGISLPDFTAKFKQSFFEDLESLRIKRYQHFP